MRIWSNPFFISKCVQVTLEILLPQITASQEDMTGNEVKPIQMFWAFWGWWMVFCTLGIDS